MSSGDVALVISGASLALALLGLIWNVWQKFIHVRPNVQVSFGVFVATHVRGRKILSLTVTNLGPGPVVIHCCIVRTREPWKNFRIPLWKLRCPWKLISEPIRPTATGILNPIVDDDPFVSAPRGGGPFVQGLPLKLDALGMKTFYFPHAADGLFTHDVLDIGVNDTYGRCIWAPRTDVRKAAASFKKDFPDAVPAVTQIEPMDD